MTESTRDYFTVLSGILLRCWIGGLVLLLVWAGAFFSGVIGKVHGQMLGLSSEQLSVIHYCGLGLFKLLVFSLFFLPWLSIRLVLRAQ